MPQRGTLELWGGGKQSEPANPRIGSRCFGLHPDEVEGPEQGCVVEVGELMLRLREGACVIKRTLHLPESQGYALKTDFKDVWEIIDSRSGP